MESAMLKARQEILRAVHIGMEKRIEHHSYSNCKARQYAACSTDFRHVGAHTSNQSEDDTPPLLLAHQRPPMLPLDRSRLVFEVELVFLQILHPVPVLGDHIPAVTTAVTVGTGFEVSDWKVFVVCAVVRTEASRWTVARLAIEVLNSGQAN